VEYKELIFYQYNMATQKVDSYCTILYKKDHNTIQKISFEGRFNLCYNTALLSLGVFPDTSAYGILPTSADYCTFQRESEFSKYAYCVDTVRYAYMDVLSIPIDLTYPVNKNMFSYRLLTADNDTIEDYTHRLMLQREIKDTLFNQILHINKCNKYISVNSNINLMYDIYVDMETLTVVQFEQLYSPIGSVDNPPAIFKIVSERAIEPKYFEETYRKSEQNKRLNFPISAVW
jgi:hypothetical protein